MWLGTDLSLTRQVAVKLLKPNLAADPVVAERFRREAIAVAQLSHPNIVAVYDAIEERIGGDRRQAVVMQLVNGKSLRQLLDEQKRLSPDLTIHIGACVAAALDCAHRNGLVHRDVKPGNILITPDGRVLLTDFGIAKGLDGGDDDLTSPNVMMGTAKYLSPEQVRGRRLDGRADLYSLGLVLYECLAGRVPFLGETDADTALARLNRDPTDLTRLRPTLPPGLAQLIHRLLARKPDDRYASGAEVRNELQRIAALPRIPDTTTDTTRDPSRAPTPGRGTRSVAPTVQDTPPRRSTPVEPVATRTAAAAAAATGAATPPSGPPSSGPQPSRTGRPAGAPMRPDRTPTSPARPKARPNREFEHRTTPSLVIIGILLGAALVVGTIMWVTMGTRGAGGGAPTPTVAPGDAGAAGAATTQAVAPTAIAGLASYDPNGDGEERNDLLTMLTDGNPSTGWSTLCYADQYMGAKQQVGVVVDLGTARTGDLTVQVASAPYQLRVYAAPDGAVPATFEGWGDPIGSFHSDEAGAVTATVDTPARWVLVSFAELAPDPACTTNPYRGTLAELTFT